MSLDNIEHRVKAWFESIELPAQPSGLYDPIRYTIASGGKRLRPLLMALAAAGYGADIETVKNQAIGLELFHNFTLLHDDIMDCSDTRRGKATVHKKWNTNIAILSGDCMLTLANAYMVRCETDKLKQITELFNTSAIQVYEGQQLDMDFESRSNVEVDEYIHMIKLKTSVLLGCALQTGAIMANATTHAANALYDFGINLGLAFQLKDDYLDTFGDASTFGKPIGGDILNDKKTWLAITAIKEAPDLYQDILADKKHKIQCMTQLYRKLNLDNRISQLIDIHSRRAIQQLNLAALSPEGSHTLESLAVDMINRRK